MSTLPKEVLISIIVDGGLKTSENSKQYFNAASHSKSTIHEQGYSSR
ncbi:hypothetical protein [Vallitalea okinawensis]|nr:hypothetical protein [Vallitalea okinawensis]